MPIADVRRNGDGHRPSAGSAGRVVPHNLEAEESLLGAMLLSRDAIGAAVELVSADDFYRPIYGHVFDAVCALYAQGEGADPVTVADELGRAGLLEPAGGLAALLSLQANTPATSNAGRYATIVQEHSMLRRLIGAAGEIADLAYDVPDDVDAAVDQAEQLVFDVDRRRSAGQLSSGFQVADAEVVRIVERMDQGGVQITGLATGYRDLDELLLGLQPGNLVIVGARPRIGKTSFALGIAAAAAIDAKVPVLFFSLEMSEPEIAQRLISSLGRVDLTRIRKGTLTADEFGRVQHAKTQLADAPLWIDDSSALTTMDILGRARRLATRTASHTGRLGLIVVDYLQLLSGRGRAENRQVEVSEISRALKILAGELELPVLALSQLSRNLEMRADRRPTLADLRESGSLEQDASVVMLLHDDPDRLGECEVIVAKNRNGPSDSVKLAFLGAYTRFANMAKGGWGTPARNGHNGNGHA